MQPITEADPKFGLPADLDDLEVVVVHDPIRSMNGGIDVIASIARFLDAPLYTLRRTKDPEPLRGLEVREIDPEEPLVSRFLHRAGLGRLMEIPKALAYQNWSPPRSADVVVTTGPRSQFLVHHPEQHRIHFFNTPARWLWDLTHGQWDDRNPVEKWLMLAYANVMRTMDVTSVHRHDHVVANSDLVRERIRAYYGRDATVAYCPVDTFEYRHEESRGYYVMVNRIVPEKRVKLVVEAFNELGLPLKIAGTPNEATEGYANECKRLAGDTVEFLGWVEGEEKEDLLARSEALVFAGEHEDFGMPPVEAMASGKPVVGVNEGFTRYQVEEGENGVLFDPNVAGLVEAVEESRELRFDTEEIVESARRFDTRAVRNTWGEILREVHD